MAAFLLDIGAARSYAYLRRPWAVPGEIVWRAARDLFEHRGEMRLRTESDTQRDIHQRVRRFGHHLLRTRDTSAQNEVVRPHTGGGSELLGEVHATQSGGGRKIRKRDALADIGLDKHQDPLQPPFWQGCHDALFCRAGNARRQSPDQVRHDRKTRGVFHADGAKAVRQAGVT
jgi:hypothetical protein